MPLKVSPTRYNLSSLVFLGGVVLALYLCYRLTLPFLSPLVWSFSLAVLFRPLDRRLRRQWGSDSAAASVMVALIAVVIVIPLVFVLTAVFAELVKGAGVVGSVVEDGKWRDIVTSRPWLAPLDRLIGEPFNLPDLIQSSTAWLTTASASVIQISLASIVNLLLTFYFLFYFLRDDAIVGVTLRSLLPLTPGEYAMLTTRVENTIRATVYGTLVVAALQGALGGAMFWWLEMPAPLFWGVIMGLLAIVPFLGAFVVWGPAAAYMALSGEWGNALLLTLWGTAVIGIIDNVLYPVLVGSRLMMHTVPAFVAVVGGVILFGAHGLVLGPVIISVAIALLGIWRERSGLARMEAQKAEA